MGFAFESWMTKETEEARAAVRAQLDEEAFAEAWEAGSKLSLDEAVALALELRRLTNDGPSHEAEVAPGARRGAATNERGMNASQP